MGCRCRERISYNSEVRAPSKVDHCHLAQGSRHSVGASLARFVFTDGSAGNNSHAETCDPFKIVQRYRWWKLVRSNADRRALLTEELCGADKAFQFPAKL